VKRALRITQEGVYNTYHSSSPVAIWVRLDQPDAFKVMTSPQFYSIMSGSGFAVQAQAGSATTGLAATLSTPLHYSQSSFLLGWALTRIASGTSPWTTGEINGDLASCTLDYIYTNFDGTERTKRFKGVKVASLGLSGSTQSPVMRLSLGLVASTPEGNSFDSSSDPTVSDPADSSFPTDQVLFQHASGHLSLNNAARSNFQSLSLSVQNKIKAYFDESRFANLVRMNGRSCSLAGVSRLKATPNDRATFEAATALTGTNTLAFTNGTNTITLDFKSNNYFSQIDESFPLDEEIYYSWSMMNQLDTSAGADFSFTYA
jgi:Phage tail tube protein